MSFIESTPTRVRPAALMSFRQFEYGNGRARRGETMMVYIAMLQASTDLASQD